MDIKKLEIIITRLSKDQFIANYQNDNLKQYCKSCNKYNNYWSCPPIDFDFKIFTEFKYIFLIGVKIIYQEKIKQSIFSPEELSNLSLRLTLPIKNKMVLSLVDLEKIFSKSTSLSSGGCDFCKNCARKENKPCLFPEKMRYSIDTFGIDIGKCAKEELKTNILWSKDHLPDYHFLVHAFLTKEKIKPSLFTKNLKKILQRNGIITDTPND